MPQSLGTALRSAVHRLRSTSPSPDLDAELLLGQLLGWERARLLGSLDEALPDEIAEPLSALIERRAAGEPVAYLLGRAWFHGHRFSVGPQVLIPRPETEMLVDWGLAQLKSRALLPPDTAQAQPRVLDVGTGSGAIIVALAAAWAEVATIAPPPVWWASDLSPAALELAASNAARLAPTQTIQFRATDLWPDSSEAGRFDLILANLPYVGTDERTTLEPDVVDHEPHLALFAGPQGMDLIRRLVAGLPGRLAPGGAVALEIGHRQGEAVASLLAAALPAATVQVHPDLAGLDRMVTAALL